MCTHDFCSKSYSFDSQCRTLCATPWSRFHWKWYLHRPRIRHVENTPLNKWASMFVAINRDGDLQVVDLAQAVASAKVRLAVGRSDRGKSKSFVVVRVADPRLSACGAVDPAESTAARRCKFASSPAVTVKYSPRAVKCLPAVFETLDEHIVVLLNYGGAELQSCLYDLEQNDLLLDSRG